MNRLITIAGVVAWLMVGIAAVAQSTVPLTQWGIAFAIFGALFLADSLRPRLIFLAAAAAAVVVMVLLLCQGFEGALLVLIAMRLGTRLDRRDGIAWIVVQTLLLAAAMTIHWSLRPALLLAPPYFGFELLAFFVFQSIEREQRANAELRALQEVVADASRIAERLRIAQELHDALGHHLTALTLNLEAALRRTEGDARNDVQTAQTLARRLLADVRAIVAEKQESESINIAGALRTLVATVPRPRVHLEIDDALRIDDPERAQIVLRCAQEIVTNAARHADAENLWIVVERDGAAFRIRAHDDGRGSAEARDGFGLRGMRARLESAGGELRIATQPGRGFDVVAVLPLRSAT